jgi:transcriptional regulator with XRE-family HTH domain
MPWTVAADIGQRIRKIREVLRGPDGAPLSQGDLARRAGVRPSQVSLWERGVQRPSRSRLERWAEREGWPITVFQEGGAVPGLAGSAPSPSVAASPPGPAPTGPSANPEDLLARFYQLMAEAAARGQAFPPELANLMDRMYRTAVAGRGGIPTW